MAVQESGPAHELRLEAARLVMTQSQVLDEAAQLLRGLTTDYYADRALAAEMKLKSAQAWIRIAEILAPDAPLTTRCPLESVQMSSGLLKIMAQLAPDPKET